MLFYIDYMRILVITCSNLTCSRVYMVEFGELRPSYPETPIIVEYT